MGEKLLVTFKKVVKREFYKEYRIEEATDSKYAVDGGIISDNNSNKQQRRKKRYCATNYMDVDNAE